MAAKQQRELRLEQIRLDGGTQMREAIDEATVADYREVEHLPPPKVFHDGSNYWMVDGFHRYHAFRQNGRQTILCEIIKGTQRDAILAACGANEAHGRRRSVQTKRKCVMTLLKDPEWSKKSSNWISERCRVSHTYVDNLRKELSLATLQVEGKDGRTMNVAKIGHKPVVALGREATGPGPADSGPAPAKLEPVLDGGGLEIPADKLPIWEGRRKLTELHATLLKAEQQAHALVSEQAAAYVGVELLEQTIHSAAEQVRAGMPSHLCPWCGGRNSDCERCKGIGLVTDSTNEQFVPLETQSQKDDASLP